VLSEIHKLLGIPQDYPQRCGMAQHAECDNLVDVGVDLFGRPVQLEGSTARAWQQLQAAAAGTGISLVLISGYRSYEYQRQIIQRKLDRSLPIHDILQVNAAPGFSEHHSGRAIDIGCPGLSPLEESFETTEAFAWLQQHAASFGFRLSFPRNNPYGVLYEPWHWYHCGF
jgi:zinc D-Ala-D-Ala carboxypeptidase